MATCSTCGRGTRGQRCSWRASSLAPVRRARVELTLDAFNLFNRVNYSGVNRVFGTQAVPAGTIRGNVELAPTMPGGFTSALAARQLQLGVRIRF